MTAFNPKKPLANARHEAFAQALAKGAAQSRAYLAAGYQPKTDAARWSESSKLVRNPKVAIRIAYLQEKAADETVLTKAWLIGQAQGILADAREAGAHGAAIRAAELLGRERNTFVEKKEIGRPGDFSGMTDAELRDYVEREAAELGVSSSGATPSARSNGAAGKLH